MADISIPDSGQSLAKGEIYRQNVQTYASRKTEAESEGSSQEKASGIVRGFRLGYHHTGQKG